MRLTAKTDLRAFERGLDTIADRFERVVVPRVLRELTDVAESAAGAAVATNYHLPSDVLKPYTTTSFTDVEGVIIVKGRGFALSLFAPRKTRTGISVQIRGVRFTIPHSFFIARAGKRVFARGSYRGRGLTVRSGTFGSFTFGRALRITTPRSERTELPINQLFSVSPPGAFSNLNVQDAMLRRVESRAPAVLKREMRAALLGFTR